MSSALMAPIRAKKAARLSVACLDTSRYFKSLILSLYVEPGHFTPRPTPKIKKHIVKAIRIATFSFTRSPPETPA
jgi:hypothetical protein